MKFALALVCTLGLATISHTLPRANVSVVRQNYNYGEVLGLSTLFYEAQRSGRLPSDNRVPWRGDAMLEDRGQNGEDLSGGYFDAGDHVKFGFPMASFTTLLAWGLIDYESGYASSNNLDYGRAVVRWSTDYFMKAHPSPNEFYVQVGDGNADHAYWGRPEEWVGNRPAFKIDQGKPGSDISAETAAALAAASLVFRSSDPSYADQCLEHAKQLYDFADQYRAKYSDSVPEAANFYNSWSGYGDELGWGAAWLYRATNDAKYLTDVDRHWNEFGLGGRPQQFGWDDKIAGVQVLMAKLTGDSKFTGPAQQFCDWVVDQAPRSPKGMVYLDQWGTLRHASNVAFVCLQAADAGINSQKYRDFARQQIGYALGDSGRSFVVGYGNNPPTKPHHRGSSCPSLPEPCDWNTGMNNPGPNHQILYGALVGGPDQQDNYVDDRNDYIHNEVATDYNAGFQSALAGLQTLVNRGLLH